MAYTASFSLFLWAAACTTTQDLRAVITDTAGKPIPGAIFYAEAWTNDAAFDFAFSGTGASGEVPPAGEKLSVNWRPGARLALAALAPGKKPMVVYDELGRIKADGIHFKLEDLPPPGQRWEPRVGKLGFPFEQNRELAARVAAPECAKLRAAFRAAYAPLASGEEHAVPEEKIKLQTLDSLKEE